MRNHFRVDPRLVHATLMNAWVPFLGATEILVVDGAVADDLRSRTILGMSAMDVPVEFAREHEAAAVLAGGQSGGVAPAGEPGRPVARTESGRWRTRGPRIVVFSSLESVERALDAGLTMDELNIGHLPEAEDRTALLPAVHIGPADAQAVRRIEERGVRVYVQPLPRDPRLRIDEIEYHPMDSGPSLPAPRRPSKIPERPRPPGRAPTPGSPDRVSARLRVVNDRGLHLRAAHALAHLAATLDENVQVANGPDFVNAKSLLGLTTLGATFGTVLEVVVTGPAPERAMEQIRALFATGFGEGAKPGVSVEVEA